MGRRRERLLEELARVQAWLTSVGAAVTEVHVPPDALHELAAVVWWERRRARLLGWDPEPAER
jgi:hypothetical protein